MYLSEKKNLLELLYYVVKYVLVFNLNKKKKPQMVAIMR